MRNRLVFEINVLNSGENLKIFTIFLSLIHQTVLSVVFSLSIFWEEIRISKQISVPFVIVFDHCFERQKQKARTPLCKWLCWIQNKKRLRHITKQSWSENNVKITKLTDWWETGLALKIKCWFRAWFWKWSKFCVEFYVFNIFNQCFFLICSHEMSICKSNLLLFVIRFTICSISSDQKGIQFWENDSVSKKNL